jgi:hypothetical protein
MNQPAFDWSKDVTLPVSGKTVQARHAGATGAQAAVRTRGALLVAYLNLLAIAGERGMSDVEASDALGRPISSICSTRNGAGDLVVPSGSFETTKWGTRRTRFTLAQDGDTQRASA